MEQEEKVVYYDLHVQEKRRRLLFPKNQRVESSASSSSSSSSSSPSREALGTALAAAKQRSSVKEQPPRRSLLETPRGLFHLRKALDGKSEETSQQQDEEEDEDEEEEVSANPFASLFNMPQKPVKEPERRATTEIANGAVNTVTAEIAASHDHDEILQASASDDEGHDSPPRLHHKQTAAPRQPMPTIARPLGEGLPRLSTLSQKKQKRLPVGHFETLNERPARWSSTPSLLQRKRKAPSTLAATGNAGTIQLGRNKSRRMSSLSALSRSSSISPSAPRLSDILQRATQLSQSQTQSSTRDSGSPQVQADHEEPIEDTDQDARNEPMEPQFYSPPPSTGKQRGRRRSAVENPSLARLRGPLGDMVRLAARKAARDLTLFRSSGQRLLDTSTTSDNDPVRCRDAVTLCLSKRSTRWRLPDGQVVFAGWIHQEKTEEYDGSTSSSSPSSPPQEPKEQLRPIHAVFSEQTTQYLSLRERMMVRIYGPYHFVNADAAYPTNLWQQPKDPNDNLDSRGHFFLVGTSLTEVVKPDCSCTHPGKD